jgi:hypothetical protein
MRIAEWQISLNALLLIGSIRSVGFYGFEQRPPVILGSAPAAVGPPQGILEIPSDHPCRGSDDD